MHANCGPHHADCAPHQAALLAFSSILERRWTDTAMFFTFLETERLAADAAALVAAAVAAAVTTGEPFEVVTEGEGLAAAVTTGEPFEVVTEGEAAVTTGEPFEVVTEGEGLERSFERLLDSQAAVMTVRGTVRDDFLTSRGLSRV